LAETFALVHGAWHGGWAWDAVKNELQARGHRVVAPDLPCEDVEAGAERYAQVIVEALAGEGEAIVVGHSLGGMTLPLVPARLRIYVAAYVPQPGRALTDRGPEAFGPGFADSAVRDELERSYWPDLDAAARDLQYPAGAQGLASRLRHQARRPSTEPSPAASPRNGRRAYIVCNDDHAVPPAWQRAVARDELRVEPVELASGHSPMLSCPGELALLLDGLARAPSLATP
jgi:pimeloyl-ACP methyl ester carboxylesterase